MNLNTPAHELITHYQRVAEIFYQDAVLAIEAYNSGRWSYPSMATWYQEQSAKYYEKARDLMATVSAVTVSLT